ncbi:hypothetical protein SETIT_4G195300v2 [Setaria italica]|uniref:Dicer dsRNA-binding fold domain-containing protein n=1 Tax=Setaria italica TaxID=4555 RepID=A0A368QW41_SETIT|nr:hypothetical protein SETIT_4G195300v2 [Setaria italica]
MAEIASKQEQEDSQPEEIDEYHISTIGAKVTTDSSISVLYRCCDKLPKDKSYTPRPTFQFTSYGDGYECTVTLPPSAMFQILVGPKAEKQARS